MQLCELMNEMKIDKDVQIEIDSHGNCKENENYFPEKALGEEQFPFYAEKTS